MQKPSKAYRAKKILLSYLPKIQDGRNVVNICFKEMQKVKDSIKQLQPDTIFTQDWDVDFVNSEIGEQNIRLCYQLLRASARLSNAITHQKELVSNFHNKLCQ